ncbi:hypothetical protein PORUE0001_0131 [Porphyromonas uenonis 60-3]|uniref:Conjugative transposon protein TraI n=1 Tax=Porphyromonas uenonis 60-3 TaxID=596327 RepID=C2MBU3_9PORP|nr:hypothetical protein [Porphyromonas uenonis]EEK16811.1 hypothetical protein PORUE0001_0131 [Porphyromonas uenonis 60-3]
MKRNHVRWLTAIITTALLLLGAGLPAKAQLIVADPSVIASDVVEFKKQFDRFAEETEKWAALYSNVSSIVSAGQDVKKAVKAVEDLSRIPDNVLRNQRNNKYLFDSEKTKSWKKTMEILQECMGLVKELKSFSEPRKSSDGKTLQMSQADRYKIVKELSDKVVDLRDKAYRIVKDYDRIAMGREARANTRRMINRLNGYKSR